MEPSSAVLFGLRFSFQDRSPFDAGHKPSASCSQVERRGPKPPLIGVWLKMYRGAYRKTLLSHLKFGQLARKQHEGVP